MLVLCHLSILNLGHGVAPALLDMDTKVVATFLLAVGLTGQLHMEFAHISDESDVVHLDPCIKSEYRRMIEESCVRFNQVSLKRDNLEH